MKIFLLCAALYVAIGFIVAFGMAFYDICKKEYESIYIYEVIVFFWPIVLIFLMLMMPVVLFEKNHGPSE